VPFSAGAGPLPFPPAAGGFGGGFGAPRPAPQEAAPPPPFAPPPTGARGGGASEQGAPGAASTGQAAPPPPPKWRPPVPSEADPATDSEVAPRPGPPPAPPFSAGRPVDTPRPTSAAPPDPIPAAPSLAGRLSWVAQAAMIGAVAVLTPVCAPHGGIVAQMRGASDATVSVSLERGAAIADAVGNRNAQAIAEQRGLALDVAFVGDRPGVHAAAVTDARGVVLAPAERLRTSVERHTAFQEAVKNRDVAMAPKDGDEDLWEIVVPVRADLTGAGARQVVGYALLEYDPHVVADAALNPVSRGVAALIAVGVSIAALVAGAWLLVLRPLALLREETELAARGSTPQVAPPARLAQFEQLAHSINRLVARLRAR
jgi:hypothetical protein